MDSRRETTDTGILIELGSGTDLEQLTRNFSGSNEGVSNVNVVFHQSFSEKTDGDLMDMINTISHLRNLRKVSLSSSASNYFMFPVRALAALLDNVIGLNALVVDLIELRGSSDDFVGLARAFRRHTSITAMHCSSWLSEETRNKLNIDELARAISQSTSLQSIYIRPTFFSGMLSSAVAGMLCTSTTLQTLDISNCDLADEQIEAIALVIEGDTPLRELRVTCRLTEKGSIALARCLVTNGTLELLSIHNTVQDRIDNGAGYLYEFARALGSNSSLKHFALHGTTISRQYQQAFIAILVEDNFSLEDLSIVEVSDNLQNEIEMYTRLNRCGRKHLLCDADATRADWIEALIALIEDASCLFYLLKIRPNLCYTSIAESEQRQDQAARLLKSQSKRRRIS